MTSPHLTLLRTARGLISEPGTWTTGSLARNIKGQAIEPSASTAVSFDAVGALLRASKTTTGLPRALTLLKMVCPERLGKWNDRVTQKEVLAAFDSAIELAEKGERDA